MTPISLRADCAQCDALCCVALAFDRSALFAFDKRAGEVCPNLSACGRCRIHAQRTARGFAGCEAFDCLGAGPAATRMFAGQSWRDGEATAEAIFDAFSALRRLHELVLLLREAGRLPLPHSEEQKRLSLLALAEACGRSPASLRAFAHGDVSQQVHGFLRSLRDLAPL